MDCMHFSMLCLWLWGRGTRITSFILKYCLSEKGPIGVNQYPVRICLFRYQLNRSIEWRSSSILSSTEPTYWVKSIISSMFLLSESLLSLIA